jgi:hypothetical protein
MPTTPTDCAPQIGLITIGNRILGSTFHLIILLMKKTKLFRQDTARLRKLSIAAEKFRICPDLAYSRRHYRRPQERAQRKRYLLLWPLLTPAGRLGRETAASDEDSEASPGSKILFKRFDHIFKASKLYPQGVLQNRNSRVAKVLLMVSFDIHDHNKQLARIVCT